MKKARRIKVKAAPAVAGLPPDVKPVQESDGTLLLLFSRTLQDNCALVWCNGCGTFHVGIEVSGVSEILDANGLAALDKTIAAMRDGIQARLRSSDRGSVVSALRTHYPELMA